MWRQNFIFISSSIETQLRKIVVRFFSGIMAILLFPAALQLGWLAYCRVSKINKHNGLGVVTKCFQTVLSRRRFSVLYHFSFTIFSSRLYCSSSSGLCVTLCMFLTVVVLFLSNISTIIHYRIWSWDTKINLIHECKRILESGKSR